MIPTKYNIELGQLYHPMHQNTRSTWPWATQSQGRTKIQPKSHRCNVQKFCFIFEILCFSWVLDLGCADHKSLLIFVIYHTLWALHIFIVMRRSMSSLKVKNHLNLGILFLFNQSIGNRDCSPKEIKYNAMYFD